MSRQVIVDGGFGSKIIFERVGKLVNVQLFGGSSAPNIGIEAKLDETAPKGFRPRYGQDMSCTLGFAPAIRRIRDDGGMTLRLLQDNKGGFQQTGNCTYVTNDSFV